MLPFLEVIIKKLTEIQVLTLDERKVVKPLVDDVNDELKRLNSNREKELKSVFGEVLTKILEVIKSIP
jgi:hypothetical protein